MPNCLRKPVHAMSAMLLMLSALALTGCPKPPETVASVDLNRYVGLWYQVAGYPFPPSRDLVGITAEYTLLEDGTVQVLNRGFVGDFDGEEDVIEGIARVVDTETNARLAVTFPSVAGGLFSGQYWIIALDDENYSYAVVSDALRLTLFILSRTPELDPAVYEAILDDLEARGFNRNRIQTIPQLVPET